MDSNLTNDILGQESADRKLMPQGLNILTILTFIGCGFIILTSVFTKPIMEFSLKLINKGLEKSNEMSANEVAKIVKQKESLEAFLANATVLSIVGIVGAILCLAGAIMMRKFKKDGFWIYVAGQIIPFVASLVLLGSQQFTGISSYIGAAIPFVFIALYAAQRKHLTV
jgi:hypothetical protein